MKAVGIIAEYNPFHNGHLYHLDKVKEMYPDNIIVLVLGSHFMQRGETSIVNKWDKTAIALENGIDIIVELPFPFATQAADLFARGSIQILSSLGVETLVFGSESNDPVKLRERALIELDSSKYQDSFKKLLDTGLNYPTALSKAIGNITNNEIDTPNDILGVAYIKEIIKQGNDITPITIKRTNNYHGYEEDNTIVSASYIRGLLKEKNNIRSFVPKQTYNYLTNNLFFIEDYFPYLKYQIMNNINNLHIFQTVDEGLENRIKKYIYEADSLKILVTKVKTKRYTYNKIMRMFTHILCNFTKEEARKYQNLRILGFSHKGQQYLNQIKKQVKIPLITNYKSAKSTMLALELRATCVYASILNEKEKRQLIEDEYKKSPLR
ncbi:MAG: nucleotidyltransferase [Bacilli bacterium]|jgi:predicted nucleotidyltransferase